MDTEERAKAEAYAREQPNRARSLAVKAYVEEHAALLAEVERLRSASAPAGTPEPTGRVRVPVPAEYVRAYVEGDPQWVDVADVLARGNRDRVWWYEIAALCEALLRGAAPTASAAAAEPSPKPSRVLYWLCDEPEISYDDLEELAHCRDLEPFTTHCVDVAECRPQIWIAVLPDPDDPDCLAVQKYATEAEAQQAVRGAASQRQEGGP